jgi:hypothetical protein
MGFVLALACVGCEPSARELKNRQELEALLSAVSLKNKAELENDAKRIDTRHASGELSDDGYRDLQQIIAQARDGRWSEAETRAYAFRERHPYFK